MHSSSASSTSLSDIENDAPRRTHTQQRSPSLSTSSSSYLKGSPPLSSPSSSSKTRRTLPPLDPHPRESFSLAYVYAFLNRFLRDRLSRVLYEEVSPADLLDPSSVTEEYKDPQGGWGASTRAAGTGTTAGASAANGTELEKSYVRELWSAMDLERELLGCDYPSSGENLDNGAGKEGAKRKSKWLEVVICAMLALLKPNGKVVSGENMNKQLVSLLEENFDQQDIWEQNFLAAAQPEGFWALDWQQKLGLMHILVDLTLVHSEVVRGYINDCYFAATKQRNALAESNPLLIEPFGITSDKRRVWVLDVSPRVYISGNPNKKKSLWSACTSTTSEVFDFICSLRREDPAAARVAREAARKEEEEAKREAEEKGEEWDLEAWRERRARVAAAKKEKQAKGKRKGGAGGVADDKPKAPKADLEIAQRLEEAVLPAIEAEEKRLAALHARRLKRDLDAARMLQRARERDELRPTRSRRSTRKAVDYSYAQFGNGGVDSDEFEEMLGHYDEEVKKESSGKRRRTGGSGEDGEDDSEFRYSAGGDGGASGDDGVEGDTGRRRSGRLARATEAPRGERRSGRLQQQEENRRRFGEDEDVEMRNEGQEVDGEDEEEDEIALRPRVGARRSNGTIVDSRSASSTPASGAGATEDGVGLRSASSPAANGHAVEEEDKDMQDSIVVATGPSKGRETDGEAGKLADKSADVSLEDEGDDKA